ncbi:MAG TPA: ATP-binding protein [Streptosporangiaceae bacterium]|nr:ATP-binding protein [Streptosporangiaceae bacterium]
MTTRPVAADVHTGALTAAVETVLAHLDAHARRLADRSEPDPPPRPEPATAVGAAAGAAAGADQAGEAALDVVCSCFGLTPFERDVLVLAAAAELDPGTGARCAAASGGRAYPTFSLALAALPDAHWSALTPVAPLRRCRLVELDDPGAVTLSRLRIDERILHYLAGLTYLDVRLRGVVSRVAVPAGAGRPASQRRAAGEVAAGWAAAGRGGRPHVDLTGADPQTRREVAAVAARSAGLALYAVDAADLPGDPAEREALARLWERESVLLPAALLLEMTDPGAPGTERRAVAEAFLGGLEVPVVVSSADPLPTLHRHRPRVAVPALTQAEQQELWRSALGLTNGTDPGLDEIVAQFSLPAHTIRAAGDAVWRSGGANGAAAAAVDPDPGELTRRAWQAGLAEARVALDELGQRIEPRARWDDLVVPAQQRTVLREIVAHVRQRATVYQAWGFESVLRRGLGVTALFAGASGTGKTLAAEVVAGELGLDLFVIDLSQVVSKYIGETEKNLRKVFDAAERGGAVLLFDEADALFGKRSEVKDSHDRYANLEISYLLMRMEAYRGLAILTTNMKQALDQAFMRRIRFLVDFPFPGPHERAEIWRRVIPREVPATGLDMALLAQLTVSGGAIRNIALSAAFLAADEGSPLRMRHVRAAARTEYLKLERSLTPGEVSGWD